MAVGVWKAPADQALTGLSGLTVTISDTDQQALQIPVNGMAVNPIRIFPTRGPVVWGARTLDGNSNDWRYISVRRTTSWIETTTSQIIAGFGFSPNTEDTWTLAKSKIGEFLNGLYKDGVLIQGGASPAYKVEIGLDSTMTQADIDAHEMVAGVSFQLMNGWSNTSFTVRQPMIE